MQRVTSIWGALKIIFTKCSLRFLWVSKAYMQLKDNSLHHFLCLLWPCPYGFSRGQLSSYKFHNTQTIHIFSPIPRATPNLFTTINSWPNFYTHIPTPFHFSHHLTFSLYTAPLLIHCPPTNSHHTISPILCMHPYYPSSPFHVPHFNT